MDETDVVVNSEESEENVEEVQEINTIEPKKRKKKSKKALAIFLSILTIAGVIGGVSLNDQMKKIDRLLSLNNVTMESGYEELKEEFGQIPGWMVDLYISTSEDYRDQSIVKLGDYYITRTGEPFENTMKGKSFYYRLDSGEKVKVKNFTGDEKIVDDEMDIIDPLSKRELRRDYVLEFTDSEKVNEAGQKLAGASLTKKS